jgi:DNA-binding PadR family transcriptional regulator
MMTNTELAILSLIAEKSRHGYEIEQVIEEREMRNWTEVGFSSIYYVLKKLEEKGLVEGQIVKPVGKGPPRKVYHITPAGLEAYHNATIEALSNPAPPYSAFLLGLSNLQEIPAKDAVQALHQYRQKMAERAEHLRTRWDILESYLPFNVNALFDLSITLIDAELSWVTDFIRQIEGQKGKENDQGRL